MLHKTACCGAVNAAQLSEAYVPCLMSYIMQNGVCINVLQRYLQGCGYRVDDWPEASRHKKDSRLAFLQLLHKFSNACNQRTISRMLCTCASHTLQAVITAAPDHSVMAITNQTVVAQSKRTADSPLLMQGGCAAKKSWMFWRDVFMMARRISRASSNLTEPPMALQVDNSVVESETIQDNTVKLKPCEVQTACNTTAKSGKCVCVQV